MTEDSVWWESCDAADNGGNREDSDDGGDGDSSKCNSSNITVILENKRTLV